MASFSPHLTAYSRNGAQRKQKPIRVFIVDDHPVICEALRLAFQGQSDIIYAGHATNAEEALYRIEEDTPDTVIIDIMLEDTHGLDLLRQLSNRYPQMHLIIFSMYDETVYAERAIRAGAHAYIMKTAPSSTVLEAIRHTARNEIFLSPAMASRIVSKLARGYKPERTYALDALTDRELEVFQMIGQGYTIPEIMERLHLSRKTVETYRRRAKEKLGFETVHELLQFAIHWACGLVDPR